MLISIFSICSSRLLIVLICPGTKRFTTSAAPMLADEYFGEFSRMVSSVPAWHTTVLAENACSLFVLSTVLFMPQNSNPLQTTMTGKLLGPVSTAHANVHRDSQSRKLTTVISSLCDKFSCVSGTSRSDLSRFCGKLGNFLATLCSHQLRKGSVALYSSHSASDGYLGSGRTLTCWPMSFCMHQLVARVRRPRRTSTRRWDRLLCSILQWSHLVTCHGAQQLVVCFPVQDFRSQSVDVALYCQLRPPLAPVFDVPKTTVLPCIVSRLTDAIGNRTVATFRATDPQRASVSMQPPLIRSQKNQDDRFLEALTLALA